MKVWIDVLTGNPVVNDSYPHKIVFGGAGLEVKSSKKLLKVRGYDVEADAIDIENEYGFAPMTATKKDIVNELKAYFSRLEHELGKLGKSMNKAGATELTKFILAKYDSDCEDPGMFYLTDERASLGLLYTNAKDDAPTYLFFLDGLR